MRGNEKEERSASRLHPRNWRKRAMKNALFDDPSRTRGSIVGRTKLTRCFLLASVLQLASGHAGYLLRAADCGRAISTGTTIMGAAAAVGAMKSPLSAAMSPQCPSTTQPCRRPGHGRGRSAFQGQEPV